jgi:hypothetical protein
MLSSPLQIQRYVAPLKPCPSFKEFSFISLQDRSLSAVVSRLTCWFEPVFPHHNIS